MRKITLEKIIKPDEIVWQACRKGKPFKIGDVVKVSSCDHKLTCLVTEGFDCSNCSLKFYKVDRFGTRKETCPLYKDGHVVCCNTIGTRNILFVSMENVLEDL